MIGAIGARAGAFAQEQARAAVDDPLDYFIGIARKVGTGALLAGVGMGIAAYYLKAASTTAMNNEMNVIGNIGAIFSNIKAPTFSPSAVGTAPILGSDPVADVQNFFGDAWGDVQAAGSDIAQIGAVMGTLAEDVGAGLVDLAKSLLAFVMHFPDILWNGMVWGIGGSLADIFTWAFPWLIILGGALILASILVWAAKKVWEITAERLLPRLKLAANARSAHRWNDFDRRFHTRRKIQEVWTQKGTEEMIYSANANPRFIAPEEPTEQELENVGRDVPNPKPPQTPKSGAQESTRTAPEAEEGPKTPPPPETPAAPAAAPPVAASERVRYSEGGYYGLPGQQPTFYGAGAELPEGVSFVSEPPAPSPPPAVPTPTAETEQLLGEPPAAEPTAEELRQQEANRVASLPRAEEVKAADRQHAGLNPEQYGD